MDQPGDGDENNLHARLALYVLDICRDAEKAAAARDDDALCTEGEGKFGSTVRFSSASVLCITKLIEEYLEVLGSDLISFASHAKRQIVNRDDVKLCARKSAATLRIIKEYEKTNLPPIVKTSKQKKAVPSEPEIREPRDDIKRPKLSQIVSTSSLDSGDDDLLFRSDEDESHL